MSATKMTLRELNAVYRAAGLYSPTTVRPWRWMLGGLVAGALGVFRVEVFFAVVPLVGALVYLHEARGRHAPWSHETAWLYGPPRRVLALGFAGCLALKATLYGAAVGVGHAAMASAGFGPVRVLWGDVALDGSVCSSWCLIVVSWWVAASGVATSAWLPSRLRAILRGQVRDLVDNVTRLLLILFLFGLSIGAFVVAVMHLGSVVGPLAIALLLFPLGVLLLSSSESLQIVSPEPAPPPAATPYTKLQSPRRLPHRRFSPAWALYGVQHRNGVIACAFFVPACMVHASLFPMMSLSAYVPFVVLAIWLSQLPVEEMDPWKWESLHAWGVDRLGVATIRYRLFLGTGLAAVTTGWVVRVLVTGGSMVRETAIALAIWSVTTLVVPRRWLQALLVLVVPVGALVSYLLGEEKVVGAGREFVALAPATHLAMSTALAAVAVVLLWLSSPRRMRRRESAS